jgi:hypothetical protein
MLDIDDLQEFERQTAFRVNKLSPRRPGQNWGLSPNIVRASVSRESENRRRLLCRSSRRPSMSKIAKRSTALCRTQGRDGWRRSDRSRDSSRQPGLGATSWGSLLEIDRTQVFRVLPDMPDRGRVRAVRTANLGEVFAATDAGCDEAASINSV